MRKYVFIVIVLVLLGSVWVLYLERENRRFVETLPKPPVRIVPDVSVSPQENVSDDRETISDTAFLPTPEPVSPQENTSTDKETVSDTLVENRRVPELPAGLFHIPGAEDPANWVGPPHEIGSLIASPRKIQTHTHTHVLIPDSREGYEVLEGPKYTVYIPK